MTGIAKVHSWPDEEAQGRHCQRREKTEYGGWDVFDGYDEAVKEVCEDGRHLEIEHCPYCNSLRG